jgi:ankyrin repeat protein
MSLADVVQSFADKFKVESDTNIDAVDAVCEQIRLFGRDPNLDKSQESPKSEKTAMQIAVTNNFVCITQALIDIGCSITKPGATFHISAISLAVARDHSIILEKFLKAGVDVESIDENYDWTLLEYAIHSHSHNSVRVLLKYGARIELSHWIWAVRSRNVLSEIIKSGFDVNQRLPGIGTNLLQFAVASLFCGEHCVQMIIDAGANVDAVDDNGCTALGIAAKRPYSSHIVRSLIVAGADSIGTSVVDKNLVDAETVLWLAAANIDIKKCLGADYLEFYDISVEEIDMKQQELAFAIFQRHKHRATDICFALQSRDLPALL